MCLGMNGVVGEGVIKYFKILIFLLIYNVIIKIID